MKSIVIYFSLFCGTILLSNTANARICTLKQTTGVREAVNDKNVGQVKTATVVNVSSYDSDNKGQIWAYINWQGQPLTTIKRKGMQNPDAQNQGWVVKEAVSCSN